ncbi:unnamed protein product [Durusdinium trenchii]|uniref:Pentatricopeptide repeat-containing protein n=1 Tax=Durusdinium trenchii TaxID=1381693 RepID=A0ABP0K084_9DINO
MRDAAGAEKWMLQMIEQGSVRLGEAFRPAVEAGVRPCTVSFTAVISAFAKIGVPWAAPVWAVTEATGFARGTLEQLGETSPRGVATSKRSIDAWEDYRVSTQKGSLTCLGTGQPETFWALGWAPVADALCTEAADSVVYNSMINACAKAGDIERADHWLERMLQAGVKPDDKTYNSLMHACGRNGNPERAELWYACLESNLTPFDRITFSTIINSCAKAGSVEKASYWIKAGA